MKTATKSQSMEIIRLKDAARVLRRKVRGVQSLNLTLSERLIDLEHLFELQQTRMTEATKAWRIETGRTRVLPDLGVLLKWLLDRHYDQQRRIEELEDIEREFDNHMWAHEDEYDEDGIPDAVEIPGTGAP